MEYHTSYSLKNFNWRNYFFCCDPGYLLAFTEMQRNLSLKCLLWKKDPILAWMTENTRDVLKMFKCKIELRYFAFKINGQEKFSM